jgi:hypothetical protein
VRFAAYQRDYRIRNNKPLSGAVGEWGKKRNKLLGQELIFLFSLVPYLFSLVEP